MPTKKRKSLFGRIKKSMPFRRRQKSKDGIVHPASPVSVLDIPHPVETVMLQNFEQVRISPYGDTNTRSWNHGILKVGEDESNQRNILQELSYPRATIDGRLQNLLDRHNAIGVSYEARDDYSSPSMDETSESSNHDSSVNSWVAAHPKPTLAPETPLPRIVLEEIMSPASPGSRMSRSTDTETSESTEPSPESKDERLSNNGQGVLDKENQAQRTTNQQDDVSSQIETEQAVPSNSSATSNKEVTDSSDLKPPKEKEPTILKSGQKVRIVGALSAGNVHKSYSERVGSIKSRVRETTVDSHSSDNSISSLEEEECVSSPTVSPAEGDRETPSSDSPVDASAARQGERSPKSREFSMEQPPTPAAQDHGADLPMVDSSSNQNYLNVVEEPHSGNIAFRSELEQAHPSIGTDSVKQSTCENSSSNEAIEGIPSVVGRPFLLKLNEVVGFNGNLSIPVYETQQTNAARSAAATPAIPAAPAVPIEVQGAQRGVNGIPDNTRPAPIAPIDGSNGTHETPPTRVNQVHDFSTDDRVHVVAGVCAPNTAVVVGVTACRVKVRVGGSSPVRYLKPTSLSSPAVAAEEAPGRATEEIRSEIIDDPESAVPIEVPGAQRDMNGIPDYTRHAPIAPIDSSNGTRETPPTRVNQVHDFSTDDRVHVVAGVYAPNTAVVVGVTACRVKVRVGGSSPVRYLKPTSLSSPAVATEEAPARATEEIRSEIIDDPESARNSSLQAGDRVRAKEGRKEGAVGTVKETLEILVRVEFDGQSRTWPMLPQNLTRVHPELPTTTSGGADTNRVVTSQEQERSETASAARQVQANPHRRVPAANSESATRTQPPPVARKRQANPRTAANLERAGSHQKKGSAPSNLDSWKWSKSTERRFGNRIVVKERLAASQDLKGGENTFLSHSLHSRMRLVEVPLNKVEEELPFEKEVIDVDGSKFQLVLAKVKNDGEVPSFRFTTAKCVQLIYARVSGPGTEPQDLQDMLERLGDFGRLVPRKAAARLELLHSPACKLNSHPTQMHGVFSRPLTDLCEIEDLGHEGSGFICENLLKELLGGRIDGHRAIAVQVRIFAPKIGVFKGMLGRKRIASGAPIQLPSSMKKVGPSSHKDANMHEAFILINRVTPSQNTRMVARLLDPNEKDPPQTWRPTKLSDMILCLWKNLGVPEKVGSKYITESLKRENLKHSFVVGLSDPTSILPAGSIFIPGLHKANLSLQEIFVTRSPCVEPRDGRMLRLVTSKPESMPIDTWEWLHTLHFGSIIFANPKPGTVSLPAQIAAGDLDGDLYFVCWAPELLQHIATEPIDIDLPGEEDVKPEHPYDPEWFSKTQELMIDAPAMRALQALIGKLYTSAKKVADESEKGMHDEDSIMYARAYKNALEIGKHGGKVHLPAHLHGNIPPKFHKFLVSEDVP
jgi:transcription antitermination factor NusG